jgi:putative sterol carrier protein
MWNSPIKDEGRRLLPRTVSAEAPVPDAPNKARANPTAEFFDELGRRGHEPLLRKAAGSARFEVVDGNRTERWLVTFDEGEIKVSRRNAAADCVLRTDKAFFDRAAAGEMNLLAAVLRGEVAVGGDPRLLVLLQRLFPRPTARRTQRKAAGYARKAK